MDPWTYINISPTGDKYIWMRRRLRNFNDAGSILNWVNATASLKNLLLEPPAAALPPVHYQQSSLHPTYHQPYSTNNQQGSHHSRSISRPITISFLPSKMNPLTQSPLRCSFYEPTIASPLTTYTLCQPNICPSDSLPRNPKRRKIVIPPSVDYHALTTPQPITITTRANRIMDEKKIKQTLW